MEALKSAEEKTKLVEMEILGVKYVYDPLYDRTVEVYGCAGENPFAKDKQYIGGWPNPMKIGRKYAKKGEFSTAHILAHNLGGTDESINLFVQKTMENIKKNKPYQLAEKEMRKDDTRSFDIVLSYDGGNHGLTDIPSRITYMIYKKDKEEPRVFEIDNPPSELPGELVAKYKAYLENKLNLEVRR